MSEWVVAEQIKRARVTLGLTLPRAADGLSISVEALEGWESGSLAPDDEQLWTLAETYGRPISYFFAKTSQPPARRDYRAQRTWQVEADLDMRRMLVARFEELCRMQVRLEALSDEPEPSTLLSNLRETQPAMLSGEGLADWVRTELGLQIAPVLDLERLLAEGLGIRVFTVDFPGGDVSGTSWWHAEFGPGILVNRRDAARRRVFTMAHELGHLLQPLGQALCGYLTVGPAEEAAANRFAAAFLMPETGLEMMLDELRRDELLVGWDTPDRAMDRVAKHFGVSREAVAWRLEGLGVLPSGFTAVRRALWESHRPYGRPKGPRWRRRLSDLGTRHVRLAQQAFATNQISLGALADALLIDIDQAYQLTETTA